jgi:hypothetical protein
MLDLTFLATGHRQHVFIRSGPMRDDCVYKIPAAPGYVMPYRHKPGEPPRRVVSKRALHWMLFDVPYLLGRNVRRTLGKRLRPAIRKRLGPLTAPLRAMGRLGRTARNRVFVAYFRRARARNFATMLEVLEDLAQSGAHRYLVPFRIIRRGTAILRVNNATVPYEGPMLVQRRVDTFFTKQSLAAFEWDELVAALHALWRHGFALTEKGENLGYRSWALMNGHVRLADTSSLSSDLAIARRSLRDENLDAQERMVLAFHGKSATANAFREFFEYLRRHINQARLDALWRVDVDGFAVAPEGASVVESSPSTRPS